MKEIIKILKNYKFVKKEFFAILFFGILMESMYVVFPQFSKEIISIIENKGNLNDLYLWLFYFFIFTFVAISISVVWDYFGIKLWFKFATEKEKFYNKNIFKKNFKDISDIGTGKLIARISNGINAESDIFLSLLNIIISAIFRGLLVIIILAFYIPKLIAFVILFIVLLIVSNFYLKKYIEKYTKRDQELGEINGKDRAKIIMENLVIRIFGKVKYELKNAQKTLDEIPKVATKVVTINNFYYKILEFILRILELGVFFIIGTLIIKEGNLEISYLVMLTGYIWFLWWPLDKAVFNINRINKVWEKYKKLDDFMNTKISIKNGKKTYQYKKGKIKFKNVVFGYSKKNLIFNDFSINFLQGKKNALVGHSGGGKSTIIKILLRLYDYKSGEIFIDNQELKKLKIESFYKEIGYLPQEPGIFDGTIRENMEYAFESTNNNSGQTQRSAPTEKNVGMNLCVHPDIAEQEKQIWEALEKAQIDDMVKNLEKGLDTEVGEKGIKLSGGEKQRLAIARIFLKDPKIIILDEPTSALDSISESKITKALDELMKGRTSIVIAHRLQTVMHSDKIIVLENGKIEAEGKHKELMQKSKIYKTLVDLQNGTVLD